MISVYCRTEDRAREMTDADDVTANCSGLLSRWPWLSAGQVVEPWVAADPTQKYRAVLRLLRFSAY